MLLGVVWFVGGPRREWRERGLGGGEDVDGLCGIDGLEGLTISSGLRSASRS